MEHAPPVLGYAEPEPRHRTSWYGYGSVVLSLITGGIGAWLAQIDWFQIGDGTYAWWRRIILTASVLTILLGWAGLVKPHGRRAIPAIGLGLGLTELVTLGVLLTVRGP